jgi:hypothetical protein
MLAFRTAQYFKVSMDGHDGAGCCGTRTAAGNVGLVREIPYHLTSQPISKLFVKHSKH